MLSYLELAINENLTGQAYKSVPNTEQAKRIGRYHPEIPAEAEAEVDGLFAQS
ncbi:hypothetical protein [Roseobacter sp.]|uniref:hypothetical protein n=1 Tax=Roseobacter sp. TaxID=1907202 RepID=UPI0038595E03